MTFVGPFYAWMQPGTDEPGVFAALLPLEEATEFGGFLGNDEAHDDLWERLRNSPNLPFFPSEAEYFSVPRGRVVVDVEMMEAVILIDACIARFAPQVAEVFGLDAYRIDSDDHYRCHGCMLDEEED